LVTLPRELLAGGLTGLAQSVVTTPMESAKINMQTSKGSTPIQVVKDLGVSGLYRGTFATLLRDIPFSMMFFTINSVSKEHIAQHQRCNVDDLSLSFLLLIGMSSGIVSSIAATPADVIKTRLQTRTAPGQVAYDSVSSTFRHIFKHEGASAFFKGSMARALVTGPLFGIALLSYDVCGRMYHSIYCGEPFHA
jgi:solute carrier family 25 aspartate/glutamate transporter 12/13